MVDRLPGIKLATMGPEGDPQGTLVGLGGRLNLGVFKGI